MTKTAQLHRTDVAVEAPSTIARRELQQRLDTIERERAVIRERVKSTQAALRVAEAAAAELVALEARLSAAIEARMVGEPPADAEADLHAQIADKATEVAANAPTVKGARAAIERLNASLNELGTRYAAEEANLRGVQFQQATDQLAAQIAPGEDVTAALESWWVETLALAIVRDMLRPLGSTPCSIGLKHRFVQVAPWNLREWEHFRRERNVGDRVECRAEKILADLGVDRSKLPAYA